MCDCKKSSQQAIEPVAYRDFKDGIHRLTMRHIDRMNDISENDSAEQIIASFVQGFDSLYDTYITLRTSEIEAERTANCQDNEG